MKHSNLQTERFSFAFLILAITFCVCLIISNLLEIKTIQVGPLTLTAGLVVFPISYIINDCLVEIYGLKKASIVIFLGFAMNLLVVLFLQLGLLLPGSEEWTSQDSMQLIFGATPRILFASFTAFLVGSFTNALVMADMKKNDNKGGFSIRAIISTLAGEGMDSIIFFPFAFLGVLSFSTILTLIVTQTVIKTLYEILILPLTLIVVKKLRHIEHPVDCHY